MTRSAEQIFHEARKMPAEKQAGYLEGAYGTDIALRDKVVALLNADAVAGSFLKEGTELRATEEEARKRHEGTQRDDPNATMPQSGRAVRSSAAVAPSEQPGQMIGRYKLLQPIGEGGFGSVWMAEQREPVKRRVALKIIKLGMDTRQVIARFEAEQTRSGQGGAGQGDGRGRWRMTRSAVSQSV